MGTRADFYVGRDEQAEWLGSIAWDGYPGGITPNLEEIAPPDWPGASPRHKRGEWPTGAGLFDAAAEDDYRERVERFFQYRDDVTRPEMGWPWPWETSHTTDYAYAFDGGTVYASCFGGPWYDPRTEEDPDIESDEPTGDRPVFPDMTERKNLQLGSKRSGVIVVSVPSREPTEGASHDDD